MRTLRYLLIAALVTNWQMTWVHAVISQPSTKSFLKRLLQFRCSGATMSALAMQISLSSATLKHAILLQSTLLQQLRLDHVPQSAYQIWIMGILPNAIQCLVSVAARMVFIRTAASTLPADEQPIVPLDSGLYNNDGLSIGGAWKILSRPESERARRIFLRQFAISMAISILGHMIKGGFYAQISHPLIWFHWPCYIVLVMSVGYTSVK